MCFWSFVFSEPCAHDSRCNGSGRGRPIIHRENSNFAHVCLLLLVFIAAHEVNRSASSLANLTHRLILVLSHFLLASVVIKVRRCVLQSRPLWHKADGSLIVQTFSIWINYVSATVALGASDPFGFFKKCTDKLPFFLLVLGIAQISSNILSMARTSVPFTLLRLKIRSCSQSGKRWHTCTDFHLLHTSPYLDPETTTEQPRCPKPSGELSTLEKFLTLFHFV